jgi:hypothetical protein
MAVTRIFSPYVPARLPPNSAISSA